MLINLIYDFFVFCGRHISSTTHSFGVFADLITFNSLHRMRLTQTQRLGLLLSCRIWCNNIPNYDIFCENLNIFDFFRWICEFCRSHISSTKHSFAVFLGLISFSFLRRMRLIQDQRSCVLLWYRTECHNIAKGD